MCPTFALVRKTNHPFRHHRKMNNDLLQNNVKMDTQTSYFVNGNINIYPACYEHPEPLTAERSRSYPGRITVLENGETLIRPYQIGANGPCYKVLFNTEHCDIQLWGNGKIVECWKFSPRLTIHEICRIRKHESPRITAFFQTLK